MNSNLVLTPTLLDSETLSGAIRVGDLCFEREEDRQYFREVFGLIVKGVMLRHSPGFNRMVRLLPHFLYRIDGIDSAIGGLCEYESESNIAYLGWFGVIPAMRRRGVASAVVEHLSTLAKLYGYSELGTVTDSDSSNEALKFYRKLGFEEGAPIEFNGISCLTLRKKLSEAVP